VKKVRFYIEILDRKRRYLSKRQYNKRMSLPNAYALEVDTEAAERLKTTSSKTPKAFNLGVFPSPVVQ